MRFFLFLICFSLAVIRVTEADKDSAEKGSSHSHENHIDELEHEYHGGNNRFGRRNGPFKLRPGSESPLFRRRTQERNGFGQGNGRGNGLALGHQNRNNGRRVGPGSFPGDRARFGSRTTGREWTGEFGSTDRFTSGRFGSGNIDEFGSRRTDRFRTGNIGGFRRGRPDRFGSRRINGFEIGRTGRFGPRAGGFIHRRTDGFEPEGPDGFRPGGPDRFRPGPGGPDRLRPGGPGGLRPGRPDGLRPGGPDGFRLGNRDRFNLGRTNGARPWETDGFIPRRSGSSGRFDRYRYSHGPGDRNHGPTDTDFGTDHWPRPGNFENGRSLFERERGNQGNNGNREHGPPFGLRHSNDNGTRNHGTHGDEQQDH